jgi:hypothetical protein
VVAENGVVHDDFIWKRWASSRAAASAHVEKLVAER